MRTRDPILETRIGIDMAKLRSALEFYRLHAYDIATRPPISAAPSTLSGWLTGRRPAPADLRQRLEQALGLAEGYLKPAEGG